MIIRLERQEDVEAVRAVNRAAFARDAEATLVDVLRVQATPIVSLVADDAGSILGHILFSAASVTQHPTLQLMALAPMAVLPAEQRRGIGSALVRAGLARCRSLGAGAVVVLGHAEYYPRFGFVPASRFGLSSVYDVTDEVFMAVELEPGFLKGRAGAIRYHPAFATSEIDLRRSG